MRKGDDKRKIRILKVWDSFPRCFHMSALGKLKTLLRWPRSGAESGPLNSHSCPPISTHASNSSQKEVNTYTGE